MRNRAPRFAAFAACLVMMPSPALAQQSPQTDHETGEEAGEIIVTAQRREERLLDVPVAVTALSSAELARAGITGLNDLYRAVPSLQVQSASAGRRSAPTFIIRGQKQNDAFLTVDPAVGVYIAEVPQVRTYGLAVTGFLDVGSVEVLKGPQGTLFGRNTTGGAILIRPNTPTDRFEGSISAGTGNYGRLRLEGVVNVPISESAGFRIAVARSEHDGYVENRAPFPDLASEAYTGARASFRYSAGDLITTFYGDIVSSRDTGSAQVIRVALPGTTGNRFPLPTGGGIVAALAEQQASDKFSTATSEATFAKSDNWGLSNTTTLSLSDKLELANIVGYRRTKARSLVDADGTRFAILFTDFASESDQWSEEFQVRYNTDRVSAIMGAFLFRESGEDGAVVNQFPGVSASPVVPFGIATNKSRSLFAQGSYEFLEGLRLTLGIRETWDKRELDSQHFNRGSGRCLIVDSAGVPFNPCRRSVERKFNATTWNVTLDYKPSENNLLYVAARRGYRSGGFNLRSQRPEEFAGFAPEFVTDLELGYKTSMRFGDSALRLTAAAFSSDYKDAQRNVSNCVPTGNTCLIVNLISNAASARIRGLELEGVLQPVDRLEVSGFYGYTDAEYKSFLSAVAGGGLIDLSANKFSGVPKHKFNVSTRVVAWRGEGGSEISAGTSVYYESKTELSDNNFIGGAQKAYSIWNARAEWSNFRPGLTASVWIRNISNTRYFVGGTNLLSAGFATGVLGDPKTFGADVSLRF